MGDRFCGEGESDGLSEKHMSEPYLEKVLSHSVGREMVVMSKSEAGG